MLKRDFEINTKDTVGLTCLMVCMKWAEDTVVKELLKFGADVALEDKNGNTALHYLCSEGPNLNLLNILIECGANVNACNKEGYSPLNALIKKRDIFHPEDVSILISKGADPSCCSEGCESPLTNALTRLKFDTAKLLVKNGADVNYVSKSGKTALYAVLATYGDEESISRRGEVVECLLEAGADTNILLEGISPLSFLLSVPIERDTLNILSNLLQYQADPNIGLKNPISLAAKYSVDAVKLLLKARGDVNRKDTDEETPLVNCLSSSVCDKLEILRVLIEAGADTNVASNSGKNPIEIALESAILHENTSSIVFINSVNSNSECEEIVNLLLDNEARCNVSETGGNSKKIHCMYMNYSYPNVKETTLDLLLSTDAMVNIEDENGLTPLHYALEGNAEEFRKLLEVGADPFFEGANIFKNCFALDDLSFLHTILECKGSSHVSDSLFCTFWSRQNDEIGHGNGELLAKVIIQILASPHKINVNIKNRSGNTPLTFFCGHTEPVIVEKLLERGADVNMVCRRGQTALHALYYSSDSGINRKIQILSSLMQMSPDVEILDDSCMTLIEKAREEYNEPMYLMFGKCYFLSVLIREILLAGGKCEKNQLPMLLQSASKRQHFSLMTTLIERGVDLNIGKTVLHSCFQRDNTCCRGNEKGSRKECLDFLLVYIKHGGHLNEVDSQGNTPLMLYLMSEMYDEPKQEDLKDLTDEIVSVLACDKYVVARRNNSGLSPIHLASWKGRLSTMELLECKGANFCDKDGKGNTCLHLLLSKGKMAGQYDDLAT
ncbi:serine/threonine-protein phosphatase 6 regulatory ankyrin repeat subunit A-like [Saccostrea cucullata]|uniref:serine/threonine-protein phosphatase 6 regulatory ankyrin repeat subunit A-like n=1 Tax=Saccostrea cuccullata TaxID=36930 RepID=UPI002ED2EA4D